MEHLDREINRLVNNSVAKSTHKAYRRSVEKFIIFRRKFGMGNNWPATSKQVAAFIANLSLEGLAASSICVQISGISFVHKINGWTDPSDNFLVHKLKEGCRRQNRGSDARCPMTIPMLRRVAQVLQAICQNFYEAALFKAAFLLAFFGFLRVGEMTKTPNVEVTHIVSVRDVQLKLGTQRKLSVCIRFSKKDQNGQGEIIELQKGVLVDLCPVEAMDKFLKIRPKIEGPLFIHFNSKPMTSGQFTAVLRKALTVIGLNPANFSGAQFRIGAMTTAAARGISMEVIKEMGRWRSQSVRTYIRPTRTIQVPLMEETGSEM
ncbi:integrase/recombinase xerD homolog [Amphiura filiformis]|uniref:integrase/recombinase xerD homolog n=1 Tax=Amphiura filiformis TaxID=82378 RepID=UPI003B223352